jgi:molecular chaperone DnaK
LQRLTIQLEDAIQSNNESAMQSLSEDAQRELENLPDEVQLVSACRIAIGRANAVDPTKASVMADKLSRMISALESRDGREADRLWRELQPDVSHWLDRKLPSNSIVTGLTR